jgi:DNA-directed RNA polymerase subunit RPC12/RpoP
MSGNEAAEPLAYGVEAEIERLMRCPECSSSRVRQVREGFGGGYGFFGFKAIGDLGAVKQVHCRNCGHEWQRPPMRELRQEAERRIDERYAAVDVENERLRRQLEDYVAYQQDVDRQLVVRKPSPYDGPVPPRQLD